MRRSPCCGVRRPRNVHSRVHRRVGPVWWSRRVRRRTWSHRRRERGLAPTGVCGSLGQCYHFQRVRVRPDQRQRIPDAGCPRHRSKVSVQRLERFVGGYRGFVGDEIPIRAPAPPFGLSQVTKCRRSGRRAKAVSSPTKPLGDLHTSATHFRHLRNSNGDLPTTSDHLRGPLEGLFGDKWPGHLHRLIPVIRDHYCPAHGNQPQRLQLRALPLDVPPPLPHGPQTVVLRPGLSATLLRGSAARRP